MKIRMGFVSNSSSSSFCIWGVCIDSEKEIKDRFLQSGFLKEYEKEIIARMNKYATEKITNLDDIFEDGIGEVFYFLREILENIPGFGEIHEWNPDGSGHYIGKSFSSIKDDETGKDFKKNTEEIIKKMLGEGLDFGILEYAWRDG